MQQVEAARHERRSGGIGVRAAGTAVVAAAFVGTLPGLVRLVDGDVIVASKPRPTSYGVALLARRRRRRPLVLDIDDWEVGFFYRSGFWGRVGRFLNLGNPNGLPWTWLMERLAGATDAVTVASRFLQQRFGGLLVPHVRDTDAWKPGAADGAAARRRLARAVERGAAARAGSTDPSGSRARRWRDWKRR